MWIILAELTFVRRIDLRRSLRVSGTRGKVPMLVWIIPAVTTACCIFCILTIVVLERRHSLVPEPLRKQTSVGYGPSKKRAGHAIVKGAAGENARRSRMRTIATQIHDSKRRALPKAPPCDSPVFGSEKSVSGGTFCQHPVWVLRPSDRQQVLLLKS